MKVTTPHPIRSRARWMVAPVTALLVAVAGLVTVTIAFEQSAHASGPSLSVSPSSYVSGQSLAWTGSVGHPGIRTLVLERYLGRPGDQWLAVDGFSSHTRADGGFAFRYPAPDMLDISFRVRSGSYLSPPKVFNAKAQDLTIRMTGQDENPRNEPSMVAAGESFGITVDTTPDDIFRSPSTDGLPTFPGRGLTLQERAGGATWKTVATTTVDEHGFGYFAGLTEPPGVTVLRVRQENYFTGANRIGWTQSFPLHLYVGPIAQLQYTLSQLGAQDGTPVSSTPQPLGGATPTGAQSYRWAPSIWDFDWESGQSLTSPPSRGTSSNGWWQDYSDGGGRVIKRNGALLIDSKRYSSAGRGDFGTTRATLQGQPLAQGRWEVRLHVRNALERGGNDYGITAELVPARTGDYDCGAHNITIARLSPFSSRYGYGVRSPAHEWRGTATAPSDPIRGSHNFAVEVSRSRITWYVDAKPVATVADAAAFAGVPMTLRLSLEGDGQKEMDQVSLFSDWQRGFPIANGLSVASSNRPTRSSAAPAC